MKEKHMGNSGGAGQERGFESMEQDNERSPMVSHQSETTPKSVAMNWDVIPEMKRDAMDEAYGLAGRKGCEQEYRKAESQFRSYNWA